MILTVPALAALAAIATPALVNASDPGNSNDNQYAKVVSNALHRATFGLVGNSDATSVMPRNSSQNASRRATETALHLAP